MTSASLSQATTSLVPVSSYADSARTAGRKHLSENQTLLPPLVEIIVEYLPTQQFINMLFVRTVFKIELSPEKEQKFEQDIMDFGPDVREVNLERWLVKYSSNKSEHSERFCELFGKAIGYFPCLSILATPYWIDLTTPTYYYTGFYENQIHKYIDSKKFTIKPQIIYSGGSHLKIANWTSKKNPRFECSVDQISANEMIIREITVSCDNTTIKTEKGTILFQEALQKKKTGSNV